MAVYLLYIMRYISARGSIGCGSNALGHNTHLLAYIVENIGFLIISPADNPLSTRPLSPSFEGEDETKLERMKTGRTGGNWSVITRSAIMRVELK